MIFERKVYSKLLAWKNECNGSKALLIEGARRIGKSTIVLEFAKKEYEKYLLIDFSIVSEEVKEYFKILCNNDFPEWIWEYVDTPEMQRIDKLEIRGN